MCGCLLASIPILLITWLFCFAVGLSPQHTADILAPFALALFGLSIWAEISR